MTIQSTNTYNYHTVTYRHSTELHVLHTVRKNFQNAVELCYRVCVWLPDGDAVNAKRWLGTQPGMESVTGAARVVHGEIVQRFNIHCQVCFVLGSVAAMKSVQTGGSAHKRIGQLQTRNVRRGQNDKILCVDYHCEVRSRFGVLTATQSMQT